MEVPRQGTHVPFLSLLRWIGAGSNYSYLLAGVGGSLNGLITRRDLARASFFRDVA
jgi:hypothetical protein